ncbi:MAG TPA: amino acid ABC transporter [Rheinheimera sp.]|nr:amino acid ABC transporter [Rheinheimera sp.]
MAVRTVMQRYVWGLVLAGTSLFSHATTLKFCYEDKQLRPYYFGNSADVPADMPGATIEHLRLLVSKVPGLQLELRRLPWKRCLQQLQQGEVDALIASYAKERETLGHYPKSASDPAGPPDSSRAFSAHQTCLVSKPGVSWRWDGQKFSGIDQVVIARPLGYAPLKTSDQSKISIHYTLSGAMDLDLLEGGRVNAITTLCRIAGKNAEAPYLKKRQLQVIYPPLYSNTGYLVFSHAFYQAQPQLAEQLWQLLAVEKGEAIYQKYLSILLQMSN